MAELLSARVACRSERMAGLDPNIRNWALEREELKRLMTIPGIDQSAQRRFSPLRPDIKPCVRARLRGVGQADPAATLDGWRAIKNTGSKGPCLIQQFNIAITL